MRSNVTTVRLTDAPVWPLHGKSGRKYSIAVKPGVKLEPGAHRNREIAILLPPIKPDATWTCDTPLVWEVDSDWLDAAGFESDRRAYVCIHQIQAD